MKPDSSARHLAELSVVVLFAFGFLLGLAGFWRDYSDRCPDSACLQRLADALHSTLQLIILNVSAEDTQGGMLGFARLALPLATSLFVLLALSKRLSHWMARLRLYLWSRRPRVAVIGCGASGLTLASYYAGGGALVVGIDRDGQSEAAGRFIAAGHKVIELDLLGADPISAIRWKAFARAIVCTGDDFKDLAIARALLDHAHGPGGHPSLKVTVTVDGSTVQRAAEFAPGILKYEVEDSLNFIDLQHHAMRLWLQAHAPHALSPSAARFRIDRDVACHVAFVTNGAVAEAAVIQAVRALVYCPRTPLRVTVLTTEAAAFESRLREHCPALFHDPAVPTALTAMAQLPRLAVLSVHASAVSQINVAALEQAHREQPVDVIYVLGRNDPETALLLAESIKAADVLPGVRPAISAAFHGRVSLPGVAEAEGADFQFDYVPVTGLSVHVFRLDAWLEHRAEHPDAGKPRLADSPEAFNDVHAREYLEFYNACYGGAPWQERPEHERWFNRHAADHALIKQALVQRAATTASLDADIETFKDELAELEHRRYVIERALEGWLTRTAGRSKVNLYRLNPTLVPFNALPQIESAKDLDIVKVFKRLVPSSNGAAAPPRLPERGS